MSARRTVRDESYALTRSLNHVHERRDRAVNGEERRWLAGTVRTSFGIVEVFSRGLDGSRAWTLYTAVVGGRVHYRTEHVTRTRRGLAIMAGRFIRELQRRKGR